jgi:hypothetical protein
MIKRIVFSALVLSVISSMATAAASPGQKLPAVLSIRDRASLVLGITQKRLDQLLPQLMREAGFDMWIR